MSAGKAAPFIDFDVSRARAARGRNAALLRRPFQWSAGATIRRRRSFVWTPLALRSSTGPEYEVHERLRIDIEAIGPDGEVQVGTGRATAGSHAAQALAGVHRVTFLDGHLGQVEVRRIEPCPVIDDHGVPRIETRARQHDGAVVRDLDRCA